MLCDIKNHVCKAKKAFELSKLDQENLRLKMEDWKQSSPLSNFYFRPYIKDASNAKTGAGITKIDAGNTNTDAAMLTLIQAMLTLMLAILTLMLVTLTLMLAMLTLIQAMLTLILALETVGDTKLLLEIVVVMMTIMMVN